MNKQLKIQLEAVVNAVIEGNSEAANASFHEYLRAKSRGILLGEADEAEDDEDDKKEDKKDEKSDDKKEDKKDDKKSDDKKDDKKSEEDCED